MNFKSIFFFFVFSCFSQLVFAQRIITGKLLDIHTKEPVEGVSVIIYKGTSSMVSNARGYFQLTVFDNDSLLITHQNYKLALIAVPNVDVFSVFIEKLKSYPEYLEGEPVLYSYLWQNLKYPTGAQFKGKEELLLVQVIVDSAGAVSSCKLLNVTDKNFEKATLSVFQHIPGKWSASHQSSIFIFPVLFKIGPQESAIEIPNIDLPVGKMMDRVIVYGNY